MNQKENKEEQFQAVIDGTENIKSRKKKEEKKGLKYELSDSVKTFVICSVCIFLLTNFVVKPVHVDGRSMDPTLEGGEIGFMDVLNAKFQDIERFNVAVVYNEEKRENWVKHVTGLPGDTIYVKDDVVYVNGMPIEEPYPGNAYVNQIRRHGNNFTEGSPKRILKDNEYFLVGDSHIISYDFRRIELLKRKDIRGKNVYVLFPLNKIKMIRNGGAE